MSDVQHLPSSQERANRINEKLRRELGSGICALLNEPSVVEIMLNPDGQLWVERQEKGMESFGCMPAFQAEALMATIASTLRTTITRENPIIECELPLDGSRFEGVIPPIVAAPAFTIRRKALSIYTLDQYVADGIITEQQRSVIADAIDAHKNILVSGGTGTGKTTLTNALIHQISTKWADERLVIIEDTAELQCSSKNAVIFRSSDFVDMQRLLKVTMRMRPNRILVGEVRGGEALALIKAWNTGHPGGVATVHANEAAAALVRIESLLAEVTSAPMHNLIAEAINVVVSIVKTQDGKRRVNEVVSVLGYEDGKYVVESALN